MSPTCEERSIFLQSWPTLLDSKHFGRLTVVIPGPLGYWFETMMNSTITELAMDDGLDSEGATAAVLSQDF
jgi:hypothetical protein